MVSRFALTTSKRWFFHQRRWILSELHKRNWVHLRGTPSLPQVEMNVHEPNDGPDYQAHLKAAQTELGCLLWICTKTRPDLLAVVSMAASHLHKCPSRVLKMAHGCWRYLRATLDLGLRFSGRSDDSTLQVWSDASFSPDDQSCFCSSTPTPTATATATSTGTAAIIYNYNFSCHRHRHRRRQLCMGHFQLVWPQLLAGGSSIRGGKSGLGCLQQVWQHLRKRVPSKTIRVLGPHVSLC